VLVAANRPDKPFMPAEDHQPVPVTLPEPVARPEPSQPDLSANAGCFNVFRNLFRSR
jgi:hypothetical protein